jgi:hypothetical protein
LLLFPTKQALIVIPGLDPGIHGIGTTDNVRYQRVDGRIEFGHDDLGWSLTRNFSTIWYADNWTGQPRVKPGNDEERKFGALGKFFHEGRPLDPLLPGGSLRSIRKSAEFRPLARHESCFKVVGGKQNTITVEMKMVNSVSGQQSPYVWLSPNQTPTPEVATATTASSASSSSATSSVAAVQSGPNSFQQLTSGMQSLLLQEQDNGSASQASTPPAAAGVTQQTQTASSASSTTDATGAEHASGGHHHHAAAADTGDATTGGGGASSGSTSTSTEPAVVTEINFDGSTSTITTNPDGTQTKTTIQASSSAGSASTANATGTTSATVADPMQALTNDIAAKLMRNFLSDTGSAAAAATQPNLSVG